MTKSTVFCQNARLRKVKTNFSGAKNLNISHCELLWLNRGDITTDCAKIGCVCDLQWHNKVVGKIEQVVKFTNVCQTRFLDVIAIGKFDCER